MKKIVIIDPSETFIKYVSRTLTRMGYEVYPAHNRETGFSVIVETKPNLVLAEINVPDTKGVELCEALHSDPRTATIPVVIVTTDGNSQSREQAKKAGCSDYLTKPLTVRDIHQMLQRNLPFAIKRQVLRLDLEVDAIIRTKDQTFSTKTKSIGEGGLLTQIDSPDLHRGSQVEMSLTLSPAIPTLELSGEVIYILDPMPTRSSRGVGIKFYDMSRDTLELLRNYIENAASEEPTIAPENT